MHISDGLTVSGKDLSGRKDDVSFVVEYEWTALGHQQEAIQVLLSARLDAHRDSRAAVASTQSDVLSNDERNMIRRQIASNPNTPPTVLNYLSKCEDVKVQERVAENPRTPIAALERLAKSPAASVRTAVAENANVSADILTVLGADEDLDVRYTLAENASLPEEMLVALSEDPHPFVSHRASKTLARLRPGVVVPADFFGAVERRRAGGRR